MSTLELISENFHGRFFRLAGLSILANILVPIASLIDAAFLGHLPEIRHLDGVALATVIFDILYRTCSSLRMGTTGLTAQARGREDEDDVALILFRNVLLAIALSIVILALYWPIRELGFMLLPATPEIEAAGRDYFNAMILGVPANMTLFVLLGWLLGLEQTGKILLVSVVGNGTNIVLDYWFVMRWGWESKGAGLATVASQYLAVCVALGFACGLIRWRSLRTIVPQIVNRRAMVGTLKLNGDIFVRTLTLGVMMSLFTNISSGLGPIVLAANTLLVRVVLLVSNVIDGFGNATESLAGIFYGEGKPDKLKALLQLAEGVSLATGLLCAIVFMSFPKLLFGILTSNESVVETIGVYVFWLLPVLGFGSISFALDGYFLGLATAHVLRDATAIAAVLGFGLLAGVAWEWHNGHILWLALLGFMVGRVILLRQQVGKVDEFPKTIPNRSRSNKHLTESYYD